MPGLHSIIEFNEFLWYSELRFNRLGMERIQFLYTHKIKLNQILEFRSW